METNGAITVGTADWLRATQGMRISAYVETAATVTLESGAVEEDKEFTREGFLRDLTKVTRPAGPPNQASS